jgi:single-stranded-DNA-specific exonuclease
MSSANTVSLRQRPCDERLLSEKTSLHPLVQRVLSARNISSFDEASYTLSSLIDPHKITNLEQAARFLAQQVIESRHILIFGDYDADGATSTALCVRALNMLGHDQVSFMLPDRIVDGYGVSQTAAQRIVALKPNVVITVDTGIASFDGLKELQAAGIDVVITDHHLPADQLPHATCIVNPNAFENSEGKCLAGVGVAFYLMLMLRSQLRQLNWFETRTEPNLADCLDLVAIGTVADLVPLDYNNRILISEGLKRLRAGACSSGITKLIEYSGRSQRKLSSEDIAFSIAPRINAAGRLDDMSIGVQTLLEQQSQLATEFAQELDNINHYRRELQGQMTEQALAMLPDINSSSERLSNVMFQSEWHEGIVGIIASKIKDETFRPCISFASSNDGFLKGSCRSITGVHMRDMLDLVDKSEAGLILRFGGHAMAAGLTIKEEGLEHFREVFENTIRKHADPACFDNVVEYDGEVDSIDMTMEVAQLLQQAGPWGQKFPLPSFSGRFRVLDQRVLADRHLKFVLTPVDRHHPIDAIRFYAADKELKTNHEKLHIHYELSVNDFRNEQSLQLMIRHIL